MGGFILSEEWMEGGVGRVGETGGGEGEGTGIDMQIFLKKLF